MFTDVEGRVFTDVEGRVFSDVDVQGRVFTPQGPPIANPLPQGLVFSDVDGRVFTDVEGRTVVEGVVAEGRTTVVEDGRVVEVVDEGRVLLL